MKLRLLTLLTFSYTYLSAQHEADYWYFGDNAGLHFNGGPPVNLTDGKVNTVEGSSAVSDPAGNLLFYTDGIKVWNKNHQQMVNGNGLHGGFSSTESALIVRQPGSDSLYYIFTTGQEGDHGLEYSIVDLSLQAGLGEVILKNVELLNNSEEQVTVAKNSNGTSLWIITHQGLSNKFYAFVFDSSGVNPAAVVTTTGSSYPSYRGFLKASHEGKKLAVAIHTNNECELYDFDQSTGIVSNPITLDVPPTDFGAYGIEFSPNDSILYTAAYTPGIIVQWDISSGMDSVINATQITIATTASYYDGALQLGPDGKIYMARWFTNWLAVINKPNVYGPGCNYVDNGFDLSPKTTEGGLPIFPPYLLIGQQMSPAVLFVVSDSDVCAATCLDFYDQSANNPTSWVWSFPGGIPSSSNLENPVNVCYYTPGTYDVTLIATNNAGSDTLVMTNFIVVNPVPTATITQSNDTLFSSAGDSYQWFAAGSAITGATDFFYIPSSQDFYSVEITDTSGCSAADTVFYSLAPQSSFSAADTTICEKFCIDFSDQSGSNPTSWLWTFAGGIPSSSTQQNPAHICYNTTGTYTVTLITANNYGNDTLTLTNYITVYATPPFPVITQNGNVLVSSLAFSYQWQLNAVDIPGATNQSYTVLQSGLYTVVIGDSLGCVNSAEIQVVISGVENVSDDDQILVAPNPSNGHFTVEVPYTETGHDISITVINAVGQLVFSTTDSYAAAAQHGKKEIDLTNVANGIYLMGIESGELVVQKKIMVVK
jgi:PKD repeat protein